jgi:cytochrome c biogenesis protein CcmG, thiol:disulfide interchange protein DsbE
MNKHLLKLPFIIFVSILLVFFYLLLIERNPSEIPSALINKKVKNFETKALLNDKSFILYNEIHEEIVLINFFATWCKPCRDEHEYIKKLSDEKGLKIIGINYKDDSKKAIVWLKELGNPYSNIAIDKKGKIAINWGVYGIPETFIINQKGIIKYRHVGPVTKKIYKKISELIKEIKNNEKS